ncbi:hypothetical protein KSP40_PGU008935 [Platanthera guangdongensis]|uniref:DUF4408 domain-containing protein n=1 Tax=Platanthera guangdongensis TaxID=2320717 RepID=A0ABR2LCB9_9ASPA
MDAEKKTATRRLLRFQQIGHLLRCLEVAGAFLLLSYSSSYVPAVARNSGEILRRAAAVLISPSFVFLLGNAIVLVLFAKSGQIVSSTESETAAGVSDTDGSGNICRDLSYPPPPHLKEAEEVVYEDKAVCVEIRASGLIQSEDLEAIGDETKMLPTGEEIVVGDRENPPAQQMKAQDRQDGEGDEDAEQFRRTIEEFIAKQQRFQRQESLTVVTYSAGLPEPVAV